MALKAGNINKGMVIMFKGQPHQVMEKSFFNLGRGMGHARAKLKNVKNGNVIRYTFKSEEPVEEVDLDNKKLEYLYHDQENIYFMDPGSFEQLAIDKSVAQDLIRFMKQGDQYQLVFFENKPIGIRPPQKVTLKVLEAEDAVKGDTVTAANKIITLETGFQLKVPLFVKKGDSVIVNTETGQYVSRG